MKKDNNIAIIGLGNIGEKYAKTFHNMGFEVVDKLLEILNKKADKKECKAEVCVFSKNFSNIIIAKPTTYMNLSGESVREIEGKYLESSQDIIVVYDDLDIDLGTLRFRNKGSAGTHNGMRSIVECLKTDNFKRMRLGIGNKENKENILQKVLRKPKGEEVEKINSAITKAAQLLYEYILDRDLDKLARGANS